MVFDGTHLLGRKDSVFIIANDIKDSQDSLREANVSYENRLLIIRDYFAWLRRIADERAEYVESHFLSSNRKKNDRLSYSYFQDMSDSLKALSKILLSGDLSSISIGERGLILTDENLFVSYVCILSDDKDFHNFLKSKSDTYEFHKNYKLTVFDSPIDSERKAHKLFRKYSADLNPDFKKLMDSLVPIDGIKLSTMKFNEKDAELLERVLERRISLFESFRNQLSSSLSSLTDGDGLDDKSKQTMDSFESIHLVPMKTLAEKIHDKDFDELTFTNFGIELNRSLLTVGYWKLFASKAELNDLFSTHRELCLLSEDDLKDKFFELNREYNSKVFSLVDKYDFRNIALFS